MTRPTKYDPRLHNGNIPFPTGIRRITNHATARRARPRFLAMLGELLRDMGHAPETFSTVMANIVEHHRQCGFTDATLADFQRRYQAMPRCGPRKRICTAPPQTKTEIVGASIAITTTQNHAKSGAVPTSDTPRPTENRHSADIARRKTRKAT